MNSHLEVVQPLWLMMMLRGEDAGVEEDEGNNQPEHPLRLADIPTLTPHWTIPSEIISVHNVSTNSFLVAYFSKRFILFSQGVCLICLLDGFLVSSVTLAVTVTAINKHSNYQLNTMQWAITSMPDQKQLKG